MNGEEHAINPEWVPADYEVQIGSSITTKDGVRIIIQAWIKSKDPISGMRAHQAIHDYLKSL